MSLFKNNKIKSYWCTWSTQNFLGGESLKNLSEEEKKTKLLDGDGAKLARSMINEENIFGIDGLAYQFPKDVRKELYFMLDDGWDVDYGIHPDTNSKCFGSLIVSKERFSFADGTPKERLKKLNKKMKKAGWKGIGIWVCSQQAGDNFNKPFTSSDEEYWIERIKWCKYAHVEYWKVDWGTHQENVEWRKRITELASIIYPELTIEHAICIGPINSVNCWQVQSGRFTDNEVIYNKSIETVKFSEVFRSYDVLGELSIPTTLDRVSAELEYANGYINCEDEMYIGAVLGMQLGIMRSYKKKEKMDEALAAIRWFKISPPFIGGTLYRSSDILNDSYSYNKNETWFGGVSERIATQSAPKVISRNTPLPLVDGDAYVLASLNKDCYAIGTFKRVENREFYYHAVDIMCNTGKVKYIGVFGKYNTVSFNTSIKPKKIIALSLLSKTSVDVTNMVSINDTGFVIENNISSLVFDSKDSSEQAFVLKIKY